MKWLALHFGSLSFGSRLDAVCVRKKSCAFQGKQTNWRDSRMIAGLVGFQNDCRILCTVAIWLFFAAWTARLYSDGSGCGGRW